MNSCGSLATARCPTHWLGATLDELMLLVKRDSGLRFDPVPGFHLYGADICLQASERGLAVVALAALCHHNSRSVGLPEAFFASADALARKWSHWLPVATPCVIIDRGGAVHILGNAMAAPRSIAFALTNHGSNRHEARISRNAVGLLPASFLDRLYHPAPGRNLAHAGVR